MSSAPDRETDRLYQILDYLQLRGLLAWRQNTGGLHATNDEGDKRYVAMGVPGQTDILGILPDGRFLAIEVKRPGNKPTHEQWEFLLAIQRNRGVAMWVEGIDDVDAVLPQILGGAWIATDFDYQQHLTDRWTTSKALTPPKKAKKARNRSKT